MKLHSLIALPAVLAMSLALAACDNNKPAAPAATTATPAADTAAKAAPSIHFSAPANPIGRQRTDPDPLSTGAPVPVVVQLDRFATCAASPKRVARSPPANHNSTASQLARVRQEAPSPSPTPVDWRG